MKRFIFFILVGCFLCGLVFGQAAGGEAASELRVGGTVSAGDAVTCLCSLFSSRRESRRLSRVFLISSRKLSVDCKMCRKGSGNELLYICQQGA